MADPSENPYAPPTVGNTGGVPEAPLSFGWRMECGKLLVQKESVLPMVDLYSGKSGETMMLSELRVRCRPLWLWGIPVMVAAALTGSGATNLISGFLLGLGVRLFIGLFFPFCILKAFYQQRTLTRRTLAAWLTFLLVIVFGPIARSVWNINVLSDLCLLVWVIYAFVLRRQFRCWQREEEWFEIRGVHPDALRELASIQERANRA